MFRVGIFTSTSNIYIRIFPAWIFSGEIYRSYEEQQYMRYVRRTASVYEAHTIHLHLYGLSAYVAAAYSGVCISLLVPVHSKH